MEATAWAVAEACRSGRTTYSPARRDPGGGFLCGVIVWQRRACGNSDPGMSRMLLPAGVGFASRLLIVDNRGREAFPRPQKKRPPRPWRGRRAAELAWSHSRGCWFRLRPRDTVRPARAAGQTPQSGGVSRFRRYRSRPIVRYCPAGGGQRTSRSSRRALSDHRQYRGAQVVRAAAGKACDEQRHRKISGIVPLPYVADLRVFHAAPFSTRLIAAVTFLFPQSKLKTGR
jgi:hypothetical protein